MTSWTCLAGGIFIVQFFTALASNVAFQALATWSSYDCEQKAYFYACFTKNI
jgi:hypothetical protein